MEKTIKLLSVTVIGLAVIIGAYLLGDAYKGRATVAENTISVTGLGTQDFEADLIRWTASFSEQRMDLKEANRALESDREFLKNYLVNKGVDRSEIVFHAIDINKEYNYWYDDNGKQHREFAGFRLSQNLSVESMNIDVVQGVSREVTDIIDQGITFNSYSPSYFYTGLEDLKVEMIAAATDNARERAERIAENSKSGLGTLRSADMGVFQIVGRNQNEDYSWGGTYNTSSRYKTARVTVKLTFQVD